MRICVVSDIHGNLPALYAVLGALAPFDVVWQLGDIVGYGPQPDAVVARLKEISASGVAGNHDAAALGRIDTDVFNDDARTAVEWTAERIGPDTRSWLGALPERSTEGSFTLVHGSPRDPIWEYVYSTPVARANFAALETRHALIGHTHVPLVFREDDGLVEVLSPTHGSRLLLDERRRPARQRHDPLDRQRGGRVAPRALPDRGDAAPHARGRAAATAHRAAQS